MQGRQQRLTGNSGWPEASVAPGAKRRRAPLHQARCDGCGAGHKGAEAAGKPPQPEDAATIKQRSAGGLRSAKRDATAQPH
jgi:hypothetical protein